MYTVKHKTCGRQIIQMKKKKNAVVNYSILSTRISTISSGDTKLSISETADNTKISIVNKIIMNCLCVNALYD